MYIEKHHDHWTEKYLMISQLRSTAKNKSVQFQFWRPAWILERGVWFGRGESWMMQLAIHSMRKRKLDLAILRDKNATIIN